MFNKISVPQLGLDGSYFLAVLINIRGDQVTILSSPGLSATLLPGQATTALQVKHVDITNHSPQTDIVTFDG